MSLSHDDNARTPSEGDSQASTDDLLRRLEPDRCALCARGRPCKRHGTDTDRTASSSFPEDEQYRWYHDADDPTEGGSTS